MNRTKKTSTNGTRPKRKTRLQAATKSATKPAKKELTADEAFMLAWQDTYNKRHKRIA